MKKIILSTCLIVCIGFNSISASLTLPTIKQNLSTNNHAKLNSNVVLNISVSGTNLQYSWYFKSRIASLKTLPLPLPFPISKKGSTNTAELTAFTKTNNVANSFEKLTNNSSKLVVPINKNTIGQYYVVVSNKTGNVKSDIANVSVESSTINATQSSISNVVLTVSWTSFITTNAIAEEYIVFTSTNLYLPYAQWTPYLTITNTSITSFSITNSLANIGLFYVNEYFLPTAANITNVNLAWKNSLDFPSNAIGYNIYEELGGVVADKYAAGTNTQIKISGLVVGSNYTFYATSYNSSLVESDPGNMISYTPGTSYGQVNLPLTISESFQ